MDFLPRAIDRDKGIITGASLTVNACAIEARTHSLACVAARRLKIAEAEGAQTVPGRLTGAYAGIIMPAVVVLKLLVIESGVVLVFINISLWQKRTSRQAR